MQLDKEHTGQVSYETFINATFPDIITADDDTLVGDGFGESFKRLSVIGERESSRGTAGAAQAQAQAPQAVQWSQQGGSDAPHGDALDACREGSFQSGGGGGGGCNSGESSFTAGAALRAAREGHEGRWGREEREGSATPAVLAARGQLDALQALHVGQEQLDARVGRIEEALEELRGGVSQMTALLASIADATSQQAASPPTHPPASESSGRVLPHHDTAGRIRPSPPRARQKTRRAAGGSTNGRAGVAPPLEGHAATGVCGTPGEGGGASHACSAIASSRPQAEPAGVANAEGNDASFKQEHWLELAAGAEGPHSKESPPREARSVLGHQL